MSAQNEIAKQDLKHLILGPEDIEKRAVEIAKSHLIGSSSRFPKWLLGSLGNNYQDILAVYKAISVQSDGATVTVSPIAEWLLDNFYIIEEQVKDIKHHVSQKHQAQLPLLKNESSKGYPRIYAMAVDLVNHTDGMIDEKTLLNFIKAYQTYQVLTMGELWALPVMLRIALIERISQLCYQLKHHYQQLAKAEQIVQLILTKIAQGEQEFQGIIREQFGNKAEATPALVEMLVKKLRRQGKQTAAVVGYLDQQLAEHGTCITQLISQEHQVQANSQVSIGNAITSLRNVAASDWNEIFESLSRVESILSRDPATCYNHMDFDSRDHYRHVIEELARYYGVPELHVAESALRCAQIAIPAQEQEAVNHVGYYLIGAGRKKLDQQIGVRPSGLKAVWEYLKSYPYLCYFGSLVILTLVVLACFLAYAVQQDLSLLSVLLLGLVILIPISDIALNLVNFTVSKIYAPTKLPKLELKSGLSAEQSTMVIVPTLLPNQKRVLELLEKLEIYYLANQEQHLYYALVGDFMDATSREHETDAEIIKTALQGIKALNERYASDPAIFYYFHRERQYSTAQQKWMGWERKRGAVLELNELLAGTRQTSYHVISSAQSELPKVKYIITLDADTNIPMGMAKKLIGTMAHPLNQPIIDRASGMVVKGHGLLQPRIGISMESANKTLFSRIFAGQGGIDPYTTAVSDVYQDLFGEGIFAGKGIYHLETFHTLLKNTIPENSVLSHDLLEGSYVRAGLVNDLELIDGYPARYNAFSMRLHRWVRGDWQLLPWLASRVKDQQGQWQQNPLSALSKWKIIDNLRRSLLNPALFCLIALAFLLPGHSLVWLGLTLLTILFPLVTYLISGLVNKNSALFEDTKGQTVITGVRAGLYQAGLQFIFIPYQAYLMTDAIIRTLGRVLVSKKNMLEWIPAADLEVTLKSDLASFYRKMKFAPIMGLLVLALSLNSGTGLEVILASILLVLWTSSPYVAFLVSQDYLKQPQRLKEEEQLELRRLARKTWAYFEDLVAVQDNFLPPDNYQVDPPKGIAHRTSPTNIGLGLVAILAARDFGYLGTSAMLDRLAATMTTIEKMEKWEGHLYNWYDTLTLEVLKPRYVSTVDSGNFVGYLIVLAEGLEEYLRKPLLDLNLARGLRDTLQLFNEELASEGLRVDDEPLSRYINAGKDQPQEWLELLEYLIQQLAQAELQTALATSGWGQKVLSTLHDLNKEAQLGDQTIFEHSQDLLKRTRQLIKQTKFKPLFNPKRQLFSIGYNVEEGILTKSYYDLLASEARLASYIAIARGEVDQKHWFRLGRKLTQVNGFKGLVSWTGTMFEYLMPLLIMKNFENSLLDVTYSFVIKAQQQYGAKRKIPWGISESAYFAFDLALNYQYKAFGVPELGLKRGLGNEVVVAPYASVMALMIDPGGAIQNILAMKAAMDGEYGLYEAIDYTSTCRSSNGQGSVVKNFMVHHQGMSVLALANYFHDNIMQKRFHTNPVIRSAELLLQERMPFRVGTIKEHREEYRALTRKVSDQPEVVRKYGVPQSELPNLHLLANDRYSVMLTSGGSGYSKNGDLSVARWKEGQRRDNLGFFIYLQNINANNVWSATYEPYRVEPEDYRVVFSPDKAEFFRKDGSIETHTQIIVCSEDNAELRKVTLSNNSQHSRILEITSYLEVVLSHPDADLAHPAFSNLFVTTEFVPEYECLLAVRRPRHADHKPVWAVHLVAVEGEVIGDLQYETDRARFIGRNRGLANPVAMEIDQPLTNTVGAVLDPMMSLRRRVKLEPGKSVRVTYCLAVTANRQQALALADKYRDPKAVERAFEFAWNRSQIEIDYLDIKAQALEVYQNMTSHLLFSGPSRRRWAKFISENTKAQPGLWPFGISGDLPILLLHLNDQDQIDLVYQLLKGHEFWRLKGLRVDLVFLAEDTGGYVQPLQDSIKEAIFSSHARDLINRSGGVFLLNANVMTEEEKTLLYTVPRLILKGDCGSLKEQLEVEIVQPAVPSWQQENLGGGIAEVDRKAQVEAQDSQVPALNPKTELADLLFYNGIGGFNQQDKEYIIHLREGQTTPTPWINVIANQRFGFNTSEVGAGYTWAENSRENKLTPWYNDPVTDRLGEVIYLRDEQTGEYWSVTPMPIRDSEEYLIRHGRGYSAFEHNSHGLEQQLTQFVAVADPVKLNLIKLQNLAANARTFSLTYYIRPVLGVNEKITAPYINTQTAGEGTLLLTNSFNSDFPGRMAFLDVSENARTFTGDGDEFIGVKGSLAVPAALRRQELSGTVGAGYDPCGALQVKLTLAPGETKALVFLLGQAENLAQALSLVEKYRQVATAEAELATVKALWKEKLESVQVSTPDKAMDLLLNSWLQYQVIACRIWSRAAYYQSGGAYGFRDQLQDVMAVVYSWPELTRKQILLHSAHQYKEGDVQHWWHPGADKGIRTRYSDDFLWLPYVTADYLECTADWSILEEVTHFLEEEPLPAHEDERYNTPSISAEKADLYEHCIRAIENALKFGEHGLPLMGSGDWNDGMNTVGNQGKGESVWLGWFLYTVLQRFIPICQARHDPAKVEKYTGIAATLAAAIEENGWDGSWYRRAYFDDGTPMGSAANSECKIDAIAQSWAVISGIGKPHRVKEAMQAVENYLVDREAGIIKLLTPPFGAGNLQPGYIKAYVPGVRENGGQYTHAAVWTVLAFAKLGMGDKVGELFALINPINHARNLMDAMRYKVEPYVLAADVYAVHPNTGRGGWSWYTGAAGWMYRVGIEHILGIKKVGATLQFNPCIPKTWSDFQVEYRLSQTIYHIQVRNPARVNQGVKNIFVNQQEVFDGQISLVDDGKEYQVEVIMGNNSNSAEADAD